MFQTTNQFIYGSWIHLHPGITGSVSDGFPGCPACHADRCWKTSQTPRRDQLRYLDLVSNRMEMYQEKSSGSQIVSELVRSFQIRAEVKIVAYSLNTLLGQILGNFRSLKPLDTGPSRRTRLVRKMLAIPGRMSDLNVRVVETVSNGFWTTQRVEAERFPLIFMATPFMIIHVIIVSYCV